MIVRLPIDYGNGGPTISDLSLFYQSTASRRDIHSKLLDRVEWRKNTRAQDLPRSNRHLHRRRPRQHPVDVIGETVSAGAGAVPPSTGGCHSAVRSFRIKARPFNTKRPEVFKCLSASRSRAG